MFWFVVYKCALNREPIPTMLSTFPAIGMMKQTADAMDIWGGEKGLDAKLDPHENVLTKQICSTAEE